jgi:hypothetical protein
MVTEDSVSHEQHFVDKWRTCFDDDNAGSQTMEWNDGKQCTGPVHATFPSDTQIKIEDTSECAGTRRLYKMIYTCSKTDDFTLTCDSLSTFDQSVGHGIVMRRE